MDKPEIFTIDLNFLGRTGTIGAYLVPHSDGAILIESGPRSTIDSLIAGVNSHGFEIEAISDVFLTHIHLDHAGGAGWMAQHGSRIHVHENGAPHLINPEKLLASAARLYGDQMDSLWGEFIPVAENKIDIMHDNELATVGGLTVRALDVPGHANHHLVFLVGNAVFSGDIGGIRLTPQKYLSLPMPPPDLQLEKWRQSIKTIQKYRPERIVPTHFGVFSDAGWHLQAVLDALDEVEAWVEEIMDQNPFLEDLRQQFIEFEQHRAERYGVTPATLQAQQIANPSFMSADGIYRYWNKFRKPS